MKARKPTWKSR